MLQTIVAAHSLQPVGEVAIDASWTALGAHHVVPGQPPVRR